MINTVYELITDVMAKQYPDRVAFRYVAADGKTVVEKTYAQYVPVSYTHLRAHET